MEEDHPDRCDGGMSRIPVDILKTHILQCLSMKEACRASCISSEWKSLWKYYGGDFEFYDIETLLHILYGKKDFEEELKKYIDWVDQLLLVSESPTIKQLKVFFDLDKDHAVTLDKWITFAASRKIQRLYLNLSPIIAPPRKVCSRKPLDVMYKFPNPQSLNLEALSSLRLHSVDVSDNDVIYLLSNSPLLEDLSVTEAHSLHNLKIDGNSNSNSNSNSVGYLKLKYLEIIRCDGLENVVVKGARNLASCTYHQGFTVAPPYLFFGDVPQLSSFSIGPGEYGKRVMILGLQRFPFPTPQLHTLSLNIGLREWEYFFRTHFGLRLFRFEQLKNLGELELTLVMYKNRTRNLILLTPSLLACPNLHKLVLKYRIFGRDERETYNIQIKDLENECVKEVQGLEYKCLKEVQLLGWRGLEGEIEFVKHLIRAATLSLERLIIDPLDLRYPINGVLSNLPTRPEEIAAQEDARNRARAISSSTTKFKWVIL